MILVKVFACVGIAAVLTVVAAGILWRDYLVTAEMEAATMGGDCED